MIYADSAATSKMSSRVIEKMTQVMGRVYGNPSSIHQAGQAAAGEIEDARELIAKMLGCAARDLFFTSGGTEADNQAIATGMEFGRKNGKNHIISSKIEHHAILHYLAKAEKAGFEVTLLDVDEEGLVDPEAVRAAIKDETCLVSIMYANNEIGTIEPIAEIAGICKEKGVLFHTDAVQAMGHVPVDLTNVDMMSVSAHKFHGPKGVGFLYARRGVHLARILEGGAQEKDKRPGTENVAAIVAMAEALEESLCNMDTLRPEIEGMRDYLIKEIEGLPGAMLNGSRVDRLPGNANFCFKGIDGEMLLLLLSERGICASSGSACSAGAIEPSHVIRAIGRSYVDSQSSLRLSIDEYNTMDEMVELVKAVKECTDKLRK